MNPFPLSLPHADRALSSPTRDQVSQLGARLVRGPLQFLDGYQSVRPLTPDEAAWWPVLVLWPSLVMVPSGEDRTGWGSEALAYVGELELNL